MKITAVRHGETTENVEGIIQGQKYGTLSAAGLNQIQQVARKLATDYFDICYSSDLDRCRLTAEAIQLQHPELTIVYDARLRERDMKPLEGQKFSDVEDWNWEDDKFLDHKTAQGETWRDVVHRIAAALNDVYAAHGDQHVLIVFHGGPMRVLMALFDNLPWQTAGRAVVENCEIRHWNMAAPVDADTIR